MKRILPALAVIVCCTLVVAKQEGAKQGSTQVQSSQRTTADVVKSCSDSVVLIVTSDSLGKPLGQGSGFIVSADGKVATNHHVIAGAHSALVKLNSGAFFPMDAIVADDPENDLAIIKVDGRNLSALPLAPTESVNVGDRVVAIGSPLGLENTVSDGIISGLRDDANGRKWLQITAPVSHGNSGGPLLAMDGRVLGVVTLGSTAAAQNLNFAVPSDSVRALLNKRSTEVDKPKLTATPGPRPVVWTSMTSGRDYSVKIDGDYMYVEWTSIPDAIRQAGGFVRDELKKDGDRWIGKTRAFGPCQAWNKIKWCSVEAAIEITRITDSRIEGRAETYEVNCRKCQPEKLKMADFVWIPK